MITENLSTLKIHKLTQAQYDRELAAGNIDESALYLTPEASPDWNASEGEDGYIKNRTHWVDYVDFEWSGTPSFSSTENLPTGTLYPYKIATIDKNFNFCTLSCGGTSWSVKVNQTKWTVFPESSCVSFGPGNVYLTIYNGELYMYSTSVAMGHVGVYTITNCGDVTCLPSVYIDEDIARRSQLYEMSSSIGKLNNLVGETAVSAQIDTAIKDVTPNWNAVEGENGHILNRTHYKIDIDFNCSSYTWNTAETVPDSSLAYVAYIGSIKIDKDVYDMVNGNLHYDLLNLFGANYKNVKFGETYKSISGPSMAFCLNETAIYNADDNTYTLDLNMYSSSSPGFHSESPTITNVVAVAILEDVYIPDTIARIDAVPTRISELTNDSGFVTNNDLNTEIDNLTPAQIGAASKEELAVERNRIDQFVALKDGSTTGDAELKDIRIGYHGALYATAGEAVRQQIGEVANAVFKDVEAKASSNVFNPNTAEAYTIGSTSGFVSEVIPCAVGDIIYGRFENADGSLGTLQQFGVYLIATNGASVLTSTNLWGKYTVPTHTSIPELQGVKVWVRESEVPYYNRSSVMVTVNNEPTEFEAWKEVTTLKVSLIEDYRDELQEQIYDLQEQVENLQSEGTGNAVQYTVQNLTEEQKAQARANIGAAAVPIVTDEDALRSSEGLTLSGNSVIPLGTWTTASTDTPYMNASGEKFCTKKIKTSMLPQISSTLVPWNYTFWKNGVNLGVQLTYTDAKAADFETNLVFDEVAVNYGYGYIDGISVTLFVPNTDAYPFNKVLVMGDSISTDYYGNYTKWVTVLMNEGFFPKDTTNDSIHATGFVAKYTADNPSADNDFLTRIEAVTNKDSYDLVVIFGGINDFIQSVPLGESGEDETVYFKPAVDYFFQYLVNNFTQARIVVLSPLRTYNPYPNQANVKQEEYAAYIREVAKSYCLPVLNLTEESGFCPFNETFKNMWTYTGYVGGDGTKGDGVHPSAEYEERFLAPMIKNFLIKFV